MIMKNDDLAQVKHVGASRMKLLNDLGINTIEQLYEMPLERLTQMKSIGEHYAKLIKDAVTEYYEEKHKKPPGKTVPAKETKIEEINQDLRKQIGRLNKRLNRLNEDLKPLWKKKYLELYIDYKKRAKKLKARLNAVDETQGVLPNKVKEKIIKKAGALNSNLKSLGKKPKKKKYEKIAREIQSFSKMLRDINV